MIVLYMLGNGPCVSNNHLEKIYETKHHEAEYKTVHHDATYENRTTPAKTHTVHHKAETIQRCSKCGITK